MSDHDEGFRAVRYSDGTVSYPGHPVGRGGGDPVETIDLHEHTGTIVTWTSSTATPPGVRAPNHLAIVEFSLDESTTVRAIGQLTTDDVSIGDTVEPVHVSELREPGEGIRHPDSQSWEGVRFKPIEDD